LPDKVHLEPEHAGFVYRSPFRLSDRNFPKSLAWSAFAALSQERAMPAKTSWELAETMIKAFDDEGSAVKNKGGGGQKAEKIPRKDDCNTFTGNAAAMTPGMIIAVILDKS
jgi:hypothetical protein